MPTLFERLETGLSGNTLSVQLTGEVGNLAAIATTVADLIENPPNNLSDLTQGIQTLPLPDLQLGGDVGAVLSALQTAIPTDLSDVTGSLTSGLQQLEDTVQNDLVGLLGQALEAVLAVYQLTQIDWLCADADNPAVNRINDLSARESTITLAAAATPPPVFSNTLDQISSSLDLLPSPLNVDSVLTALQQLLQKINLDSLGLVRVPILDDLRDPLDTLVTWRSLPPAGVLNHMVQSLQTLRQFLASPVSTVLLPIDSEVAAIQNQLTAANLAALTDDLTTRLNQLKALVDMGNLSSAGTAIASLNSLLDQHSSLRSTLQTNLAPQVVALRDRLAALPEDLEDQISRTISILQPNTPLEILTPLADAIPSPIDQQSINDFQAWLESITQWLQSLVDAIDLTAIKDPISTVAESLQTAVNGLDDGLVNVTLAVQSLFGELDGLLTQVDVAALVHQVEVAIAAFKTQIIETLSTLFQPVRAVVNQLITTIHDAIDQFDPEVIVNALKEAIQVVTGILEDPNVVSALTQIRGALTTVTQQLQALSFSPLVDQVVTAIEELSGVFATIDTSVLSTPLKLALQAALALLPEDLTPVTDPLIAEFGQLIETGPVPLLQIAQQQPQRLLDQVRSFQPTTLIGDALSQPYQTVLTQMQAFQPSQLLQPVQQELDALKDRIKQNANPAQALTPLIPLFQNLLQTIDQLQPSALVQPLEDLLSQAINQVLEALPVDAVFDQVDDAMQRVQQVIGLGDRFSALIQRVVDMLNGFANPQAQVDAWLTESLANLDGITNVSALQPLLVQLSGEIDQLKANGLKDRFNQTVDTLLATLQTLNPQTRLLSLVQAYRSLSPAALNALPDSPEKIALVAVIARFNPIQSEFNAPYQLLTDLTTALNQSKTALQMGLEGWDERYHTVDSVLAPLQNLTASPTQLRQWVRDGLQGQLVQPLARLFAMTAPLSETLGRFLSQFQGLMTVLQAKVADLLSGPGSLGEIRTDLQAIIQRLQGLNLAFLTDSLNTTFATLRSQVEAFDPAQLQTAIATPFNQIVDSLDLSQVLPPADIAQLNTAYAAVIAKLQTLDPAQLITTVVQPEFDTKVIPLLETFDLTAVLTALLDRLHHLDEELQAEMGRVNEAYQKLRQSMPSISISLDLDIDIGVSL